MREANREWHGLDHGPMAEGRGRVQQALVDVEQSPHAVDVVEALADRNFYAGIGVDDLHFFASFASAFMQPRQTSRQDKGMIASCLQDSQVAKRIGITPRSRSITFMDPPSHGPLVNLTAPRKKPEKKNAPGAGQLQGQAFRGRTTWDSRAAA